MILDIRNKGIRTQTKIKGLAYILFLFALIPAEAQNIIQLTKGLIIGHSHQYGREALYTDRLAYELYKNTLKTPTEGGELFTNDKGNSIKWKSIAADKDNKFKDSLMANGYLYLTHESPVEQMAYLNITGHSMLYFNGTPRSGDIYSSGWLYLPVVLKKGLNEMYIRSSRFSAYEGISAKIIIPDKAVSLNKEDPTLPYIVLNRNDDSLLGALVVINGTNQTLSGLQIKTTIEGKEIVSDLPSIIKLSTRKVPFKIDPRGVNNKGTFNCKLSLIQKGKVIDEQEVKIEAVEPTEHYSNTFISDIDGSLQYYSVAPQSKQEANPALFLSVHGAGVEAIGQAKAYKQKDWGVLVAPTNRRPRGFNWEDWGRLDALEVLELAKKRFTPDPARIYLTGHSMGGHGTWYLGATYPGKWAAIAPCAGYPTLSAYGSADGKIPEAGLSSQEKLLLQASSPSNVIELAQNYKASGIYIHHGDSDEVVSVKYAQQMRQVLGSFHQDFSYYEYPGGRHWFGNESVDWAPIFEYFKWHKIKDDSAVNTIDFTTANTAISSQYRWMSVLQQEKTSKYSRIKLDRDKKLKTISGTTDNIQILSISLKDFNKGDTVNIELDKNVPFKYVVKGAEDIVYFTKSTQWQIGQKTSATAKGTVRNGTFKEPFNNRMVFVYSTAGTPEENNWSFNKARYDSEVWYYRGNGAVDVIADKEFSASKYADRGVIIYGNSTTNTAWKKLLTKCPINVKRGGISVGDKQYSGDDLAAYFMWPRSDSNKASVGVVSGSGLKGMRAAEANQYFAAGSGFPDYMIYSIDLLKDGAKSIKDAGFYGNDWSLEKGQRAISN